MQQSVKHPEKKMFWGCFSYYGVGRLQPVEGMMKSDHYIEIRSCILIPEMNKTFPDATAIFQHDHAPCHTKKVKTFLQTNQITVLDWPGNSLDLSPIENRWSSFLKMKLREKDCTTKPKHISAIPNTWYRDDSIDNHCKKHIDSMPKRIQKTHPKQTFSLLRIVN